MCVLVTVRVISVWCEGGDSGSVTVELCVGVGHMCVRDNKYESEEYA